MRFVRPGEVVKMLGVSRSTPWRMVRAAGFPRPVEITERSLGYRLADVETWMHGDFREAPGCGTVSGHGRVR